jgi:hypothetical protein
MKALVRYLGPPGKKENWDIINLNSAVKTPITVNPFCGGAPKRMSVS